MSGSSSSSPNIDMSNLVSPEHEWYTRSTNEPHITAMLYDDFPNLFTLMVWYNGVFSSPPCRTYDNGYRTYIDYLKTEEFSMEQMDQIMVELGFIIPPKYFYYFKKPNTDLDSGLVPLIDATELTNYIGIDGCREIEVYALRQELVDPVSPEPRIWHRKYLKDGVSCSKKLF